MSTFQTDAVFFGVLHSSAVYDLGNLEHPLHERVVAERADPVRYRQLLGDCYQDENTRWIPVRPTAGSLALAMGPRTSRRLWYAAYSEHRLAIRAYHRQLVIPLLSGEIGTFHGFRFIQNTKLPSGNHRDA